MRFAFHSRNLSCTDTRRSPWSWAITSVHGTSSLRTNARRGTSLIVFLLDGRCRGSVPYLLPGRQAMWFAMRKESLDFIPRAPAVHVAEAHVAAPRPAVFAAFADPRSWPRWFP